MKKRMYKAGAGIVLMVIGCILYMGTFEGFKKSLSADDWSFLLWIFRFVVGIFLWMVGCRWFGINLAYFIQQNNK